MSDEEEVRRQTSGRDSISEAKRPSGERKQKEGIYLYSWEIGMVFIRKIFITHVNEF